MARFQPSVSFLKHQEGGKSHHHDERLLDKLADELLDYHPTAYQVLEESRAVFQAATPEGYELDFSNPDFRLQDMVQSLYDKPTLH